MTLLERPNTSARIPVQRSASSSCAAAAAAQLCLHLVLKRSDAQLAQQHGTGGCDPLASLSASAHAEGRLGV